MQCCCTPQVKNPLKEWLQTQKGQPVKLIREWVLGLHLYWHFWSPEEDAARHEHNFMVHVIADQLPVPPSDAACQRLAYLHHAVQHMYRLSCHRLHLGKWIQECLP